MKKRQFYTMLAATLISCTACTPDVETRYVRGTLYTDSTLTTPMSDEHLVYSLFWGEDTLGECTTDANGRFGFAYNVTIDPIVRKQTKFYIEYDFLLITLNNDTLFAYEYPKVGKDPLVLYPGCRKGWLPW